MSVRARIGFLVISSLVATVPIGAQSASATQQPAAWKDPSPHRTRLVSVAPGVSLEVLDWGGSGPPLAFLAGGGHTSHVYDNFAPRFTSDFHVYAVTRRGVGKSSRPTTGYDTARLVADLVTVLDSFSLAKATFVAHSFGGSELNLLATLYGSRVERLVYLDAAFDYRAILDSPEWTSGQVRTPEPRVPADDENTISNWKLFAERVSGPGFPESEVRALYGFDAAGRLVGRLSADSAMFWYLRGVASVDLTKVRVPVLAIYARIPSAEAMFPFWDALDAAGRTLGESSFQAVTALHVRLRSRFVQAVPQTKVVFIPGARHYVFLTDPGEVEHAMREFLLQNTAAR